jgi:hypothetical protein
MRYFFIWETRTVKKPKEPGKREEYLGEQSLDQRNLPPGGTAIVYVLKQIFRIPRL